jgi:Flp pilus assembly protein TadG
MSRCLRQPIGQDCAGTVAIEFALVAPLFLMLLFGSVEFGRLLWTKQALQEAATAGARCMGIAQSSCASASQTQTYVQQVARGWGISLSTAAITASNTATCGGSTAAFSQVSIASTFSSAASTLIRLARSISLSASACYPNNPSS